MSSSDHTPTADEQQLFHEIDRVQLLVDTLPDDAAHQPRLATMGLLVSFFAHECRNRLTPIIGYARTASQSPTDHDLVQTALTHISESAYDLAQLTDLILGQPSKQDSICDAEAAWNLACQRLTDDLAQDRIHLQVDFEPDLLAPINPCALSHVYENLVRNAIEAGDKSTNIKVRACSTRNSHEIRIEIEDDAGGMLPEVLQAVGRSMISSKGSTGLGLALCRFLIDGAGGAMTIESRHQVGTVVSITLPKARPAQDQSATTQAEEGTHPRD